MIKYVFLNRCCLSILFLFVKSRIKNRIELGINIIAMAYNEDKSIIYKDKYKFYDIMGENKYDTLGLIHLFKAF